MQKHCCDHKLTQDEAKALLADVGLSKTKTKITLLIELSKAHTPISISELHQRLKDKCNISTVFRAINQFKSKSLTREINFGEDFFRYEFINPTEKEHHHHIRCRNCGKISLIEKCDITIFEKMVAKLGFKEMDHTLEFSGICSPCSVK